MFNNSRWHGWEARCLGLLIAVIAPVGLYLVTLRPIFEAQKGAERVGVYPGLTGMLSGCLVMGLAMLLMGRSLRHYVVLNEKFYDYGEKHTLTAKIGFVSVLLVGIIGELVFDRIMHSYGFRVWL